MKTRNVTPSLPDDLLRRVKILAARRDVSISRLLTESPETLVDREEGCAQAQMRHLRLLRRGLNLGTRGGAPWTSIQDGPTTA